jgi:hypothetical protein
MKTLRKLALGTTAGALLFTALAASAAPKGPCVSSAPTAPSVPGQHVPQCTARGYFKPVQVNASTGYRFCVNPETGVKLEGKESAPGQPAPSCGPCITALAASLTSDAVGTYVPACDATGLFKPLQRNATTGLRWCVNPKTGEKVKGTEKKAGEPAPACG